jgi:EAL domain-containing protein (putative c-di-GMP-specific phosphodiesterase class I)
MVKRQSTRRRKKARLSMSEGEFETTASYISRSEILETLSELSIDIDTYEFLSELFFEFLANEVRTTSPSPERLNLYINTRHQIHQLYELARAAKALRTHQHQQVGE